MVLATGALAQNAPVPMERPATGSGQNDDTMTDVDPEVLARCKREAAQKKLKGSERATFMNACVEPED
ncbi:PsiF family protein [Methylobacterium sp. J-030]|uniref:PsiF family protein n=1 Tax=Methylobacterium sp. J-030 TaxID=2836627 RepID=UPI001FBB1D7B|nr:PsiF family protein [Methylobacterium sp. J-030]MCJ2067488.1 PsiF family protein [Methylobacterium sp. J-030]